MSNLPPAPPREGDPEDRIRGVMHLIQARPDLVERQCRSALAGQPESTYALRSLALTLNNQDRLQEALEVANAAVRLAPDDFVAHNYRALVLMNLGRLPESNEAIQEAMRLAPDVAANFDILALIAKCESDWKKLASAAADALRLEPDHERCASLYVLALRELERGEEAIAAGRRALEQHPNSAAIHAELAETLLTRGLVDESLEHFRQALQLDPNSERARSGVVTALKARYWIYRVSYEFFRLPSDIRKFSGVGLVILARLANSLAHDDVERAAGVAGFLALMVLIIAIIWLAEPVFNVLLRVNPVGRWALNDRERRESNIVAACFVFGILALAGWPIFHWLAIVLGVGVTLMAAPLTAYWRDARSAEEKRTAAVLSCLLVATLLVGLISFALDPAATASFRTWPAMTLISVVLFGFLTVSSVFASDPSTFRR